MKKLILILFILISILAESQDTRPSLTTLKTIPTYSFSFNQADSTVWLYKGSSLWASAPWTWIVSGRDTVKLKSFATNYKLTKKINLADTTTNKNGYATYFQAKFKTDTTGNKGWVSNYRFATKIDTSQKAHANGVATLDGNGKVPASQLSGALLGAVVYISAWNPATNSPTLPTAAGGNKGYYYIANAAGTYGGVNFGIGDWYVSNGSTWDKITASNTVASVFGRTGNITAASGDYNTSQVTENSNLYFTNQRVYNSILLTKTGGADSATWVWNGSQGVLNIPKLTGGSGGSSDSTNMYEFEIPYDGATTQTIPFTLKTKTEVFANGSILPASRWSGVGSTTLTLVTPTKQSDYIKVYAAGKGGGSGGSQDLSPYRTKADTTLNTGTASIYKNSLKENKLGNPAANGYVLSSTTSGTRSWISVGGSMTWPTGSGIPIVSSGSSWGTTITDNSANWQTAYTDRLKWDGGSTGLTAATGRTSLGGTTIGQSMFTLTNPTAVTFPRFNADNTVSALDAATFRTAIGAGTSSTTGTVTSVAALTLGTAGTDLGSTVATGTTTPVITLNVPTASATNRGALSSADWSTFNGKQAALGFTPYNATNPSNYIALTALSSTATGLTYTNTTGVFSLTGGYYIPTTTDQTNWNKYNQWDGGSTGLTSATGRTSLGATTVGSNFFTLANPTAITFPRINADNSVSSLDASTFRTAIGAGTSSTSGTVTSVSTAAANNGVTATWSMASPTPALTIGLGAITPTSVNGLTLSALATGFTVAGGTTSKTLTVPLDASVSGTNTGDNATNSQYSGLVSNATHTGDVTGSTALTIASNAVTYAKSGTEFKGDLTITSNAIDWSTGMYKDITLAGNTTYTYSNLEKGKTIILKMTGSFTPTWPTGTTLINGGTYTGAKVNYIILTCLDTSAPLIIQSINTLP